MKIARKQIYILSFFYIYIPVVLIIAGWCNLWFAILSLSMLGYAFYRTVFKGKQIDGEIQMKRTAVIVCVAVVLIFAYYAGWGGMVPQASDWGKHNAVLKDLMQKEWPVLYDNDGEHSMLTYYLGQYIVPAFCGKVLISICRILKITDIFGLGIDIVSFFIAEATMFLWNCIGLSLVCLNLFFLLKNPSKKAIIIAAFCLFGNPLVLGKAVYGLAGNFVDFSTYNWLDADNYMLQYSTNFVLIKWTFQHCLVPWLATALMIGNCVEIKHYVVLGLPVAFFSPFGFLGVLPYMFADLAMQIFSKSKESRKEIIRSCFSIPNLFILFSLGTFLVLYYLDFYFADGKPDTQQIELYLQMNSKDLFAYAVFCLFTFGIYALYLFWDFRKNLYYWVSVAVLMILPFFRMGQYNDLVMRGSIPALFVICVFCLDIVINKREKHSRLFVCSFLVFLLISFYYPIRDFTDMIRQDTVSDLQERSEYAEGTLEEYANRKYAGQLSDDMVWNYYTYDAEDCIFLKTIGKH